MFLFVLVFFGIFLQEISACSIWETVACSGMRFFCWLGVFLMQTFTSFYPWNCFIWRLGISVVSLSVCSLNSSCCLQFMKCIFNPLHVTCQKWKTSSVLPQHFWCPDPVSDITHQTYNVTFSLCAEIFGQFIVAFTNCRWRTQEEKKGTTILKSHLGVEILKISQRTSAVGASH